MCRVLQVGRSNYYAALTRGPSAHCRKDLALREQLGLLHAEQRQTIGGLKAWHLLNQRGIPCGKHRVARLRKLDGIEARRYSKFKVMRAHQKTEPPAVDLVHRHFAVAAPDKVWVSDTVALRFACTSQHRDNRVHNTNPTAGKGTQDFEGYGDNAFRLQALVKPNKDFDAWSRRPFTTSNATNT